MIALVMRGSGCLMSVCCLVVELDCSFVLGMGHGGSPLRLEDLASHPAAVYGEDRSCDVVACGGTEK